ncbi:MAG: class I SAM-dependent methyltransferase [Anaerolineae bacterium]|nr:class I SAM-dependent methyltransferase [Anaerolineae bacterium]
MEWTNCNLCGSERTEVYREGRDRQLGGSERFRLVRCLQCGLIYLNPRPRRDEIGRYYPADYEPFTRLSRHQGGRLARWSYRRYLDKRCARLPSTPGRLLDVGCATGDFLARAREHGWQVQGVEPGQAAAQAARRQYGLDVFSGDLAEAHLPSASFDAVTLWDVLEHLYDPRAELAEIHRILKSGGVLLIELPNVRSFDAALFGRYWIGLDMPRHLYLFPPSALDALLEQSGFAIVSRRCSSGGYGAFVASLSFWSEEQRSHLGKWMQRLATGLSRHPARQWLLLPYIYLAYATGRGPEITLLCRKRAG